MTRNDPFAARQELRQRILAKLAERVDLEVASRLSGDLVAMFYTVEDEWNKVDVTTLGEPGESWIDNRFLVARLPVQGVAFTRVPDRTAASAGRPGSSAAGSAPGGAV